MTCEKLEKMLYCTCCDRIRKNGVKLQQGQLKLDIRKHFVRAGLQKVLEQMAWACGGVLIMKGADEQFGQTCIRNDTDIVNPALEKPL